MMVLLNSIRKFTQFLWNFYSNLCANLLKSLKIIRYFKLPRYQSNSF